MLCKSSLLNHCKDIIEKNNSFPNIYPIFINHLTQDGRFAVLHCHRFVAIIISALFIRAGSWMTQNQGSPCALLAAVGCSAHVPLAPHCALRASCSALAETAGRVYQDHVAHLELFSFSREQKRERERES